MLPPKIEINPLKQNEKLQHSEHPKLTSNCNINFKSYKSGFKYFSEYKERIWMKFMEINFGKISVSFLRWFMYHLHTSSQGFKKNTTNFQKNWN